LNDNQKDVKKVKKAMKLLDKSRKRKKQNDLGINEYIIHENHVEKEPQN
jgi:hypothetical protein